MSRSSVLGIVVASAFAVSVSPASAEEQFAATAVISLPNNQHVQSFDISYVDPLLGLYILGDRTNNTVDVIDTGTNTVLTQVNKGNFAGAQASNDISGPNGVLIVRHREIWAGDAPCGTCTPATTDSSVKVIDLFNQQLTHVIHTGGSKRSDEMCWDPRDHLVMVANNADTPPFASIIDTSTYGVVATITFDGTNGAPNSNNGIEQCSWDFRTGNFYITVPGIAGEPAGQGGVAEIDPFGNVVKVEILPVGNCDTPQGSAVGPDHQILIGCNGSTSLLRSSVVIDDINLHILATINNSSGPDEVWYNEGDDHYFLARSSTPADNPNEVLGVIDAGVLSGDETVGVISRDPVVLIGAKVAGRNAHSVAADAVLNQVYVPIPAGVGTICQQFGGVIANGCIAVIKAPNGQ